MKITKEQEELIGSTMKQMFDILVDNLGCEGKVTDTKLRMSGQMIMNCLCGLTVISLLGLSKEHSKEDMAKKISEELCKNIKDGLTNSLIGKSLREKLQ